MRRASWALGLCVGIALTGCDPEPELKYAEETKVGPCDACSGACDRLSMTFTVRVHVEGDLDYDVDPPFGGIHNQCWAPWGVHTDPVRRENFIHNLEHGGLVIAYHCPDGCPAELEQLEALAKERELFVVTPYAEMERRFAFLLWGERLMMDCVDADAIRAFVDEHYLKGPEVNMTVPPPQCAELQ